MNHELWIKKLFKREHFVLIAILVAGAFLRFYHLPQWFHFATDEARDLFIIKDIFENGDIPFRGPTLSITGDKAGFLGPAYYYLIIIPFLIGGGHPIGPVIFTALLSIAAIYLLYRIGNDFMNLQTGLIAALIYAVSFLTITFSRTAWNPNILPFFITLGIYSFLKISNGRESYLIWLALSTAIAVQLHSTAFLWPIVILISWILAKPKIKNKQLYLCSIGIFIIMLTPWIAAEIRSGFANSRAYLSILNSKTETFSGEIYIPPSLWSTFFNFFDEILTNRIVPGLTVMIIAGMIIVFAALFISNLKSQISKLQFKIQNSFIIHNSHLVTLLLVWLFISLIGYYFYKHILFIHYFIFLFPLAILLASIFLARLWQKGLSWKIITTVTIVIIIGTNLYSFADYARAMSDRRLDKFTHATDTPFIDIDKAVRYIEKDADQPFRLHFLLPPGPPFQNNRAYEYMFDYYEKKQLAKGDAPIIYAIIQPKDLGWHKEVQVLGKVEEIKEFGVVRILKIRNPKH